ncbi:MAG: inositol monophosphatase family protein [Eubacteriales bacterium]
MITDISSAYGEICSAALRAGQIIAETSPENVGVFKKSGDANFVTESDIRIQKFLRSQLSAACPEAGFLGEEDDGASSSGPAKYVFIVDPIDGTSNYMFGLRLSTVSIALCDAERGRPVAAAVCCPSSGEVFSALEGGGAFLNGKQIRVSDRKLQNSLAAFGSTPYDRTLAPLHMEILSDIYSSCLDVRNLGSAALHLAYLAAGRFGGFYEMRLCPWDYAAGALLITEAGGRITNFSGNFPSLESGDSIVAGTPAAYPEMLGIISSHIK